MKLKADSAGIAVAVRSSSTVLKWYSIFFEVLNLIWLSVTPYLIGNFICFSALYKIQYRHHHPSKVPQPKNPTAANTIVDTSQICHQNLKLKTKKLSFSN